MVARQKAMQEFQQIPGVGVRIAEDLWNIGLRSITELDGADPDELYDKICKFQKTKVDRCMLYVMRCAVYYASQKKHDPQLLKWWNWKDTAVRP